MSRCLVPLLLVLLAGCQHYDVEVILDADGSGTRSVELRGDAPGPTPDASLSRLRMGFTLAEEAGWAQVESDDPRRLVLRRQQAVQGPEGWTACSGDIDIPGHPGALPADEDVRFHNHVEVEMSDALDRRSLSYRERFEWSGILPAASAIIADLVLEALEEIQPTLSALERASLHGLAAGAAQRYLAMEQAEASEAAYHTFLDALAAQMQAALAAEHPEMTRTQLASTLDSVLGETSKRGDSAFEARLPGADLVATTDLTLQLTLPGPVLESNADRVEGNRATWRFGLSEALFEPVQLYARTELGP